LDISGKRELSAKGGQLPAVEKFIGETGRDIREKRKLSAKRRRLPALEKIIGKYKMLSATQNSRVQTFIYFAQVMIEKSV